MTKVHQASFHKSTYCSPVLYLIELVPLPSPTYLVFVSFGPSWLAGVAALLHNTGGASSSKPRKNLNYVPTLSRVLRWPPIKVASNLKKLLTQSLPP